MGEHLDAEIFQGFADELRRTLAIRVKYVATVVTVAGNGGPGGRHDVLFHVHVDDRVKFSIPKLRLKARWWGDVFFNDGQNIYPDEFLAAHPDPWIRSN
jgi:hypothetical protein